MSTDDENWRIQQAQLEMARFRFEKALRGEDDGYRINLNQKPPAPLGVPPEFNHRLEALTKDRQHPNGIPSISTPCLRL